MKHASRAQAHASRCAAMLAGTAAMLLAARAGADPVGVVNALRAAGCAGGSGGAPAVRRTQALDDVARELARTQKLDAAMASTRYPAAASASVHVRGSRADADIRKVVGERYCDAVADARFTEAGVHARGDETWIVLAARAEPLPAADAARDIAARVLALVNAARAEPRSCGRRSMEPAPPVTLAPVLSQIAAGHARDMAARGNMEHRGADGSTPPERATRGGYVWRAVGENIAAGQRSAEAVVAAWLESPGHCANIMEARYTEMGVAYALVEGRNPPIYWAQMFGTPQ